MENNQSKMELIVLRTFDNYFSANILLTKLRDSGIECYLKDEYTVTIDPLLSNAIGGIKLVVKKQNAPEARAMLRDFDTEYQQNSICPNCGTPGLTLMPKRTAENMVTAIASWLFASYAVSAENIYKCDKCGFETEILAEID